MTEQIERITDDMMKVQWWPHESLSAVKKKTVFLSM